MARRNRGEASGPDAHLERLAARILGCPHAALEVTTQIRAQNAAQPGSLSAPARVAQLLAACMSRLSRGYGAPGVDDWPDGSDPVEALADHLEAALVNQLRALPPDEADAFLLRKLAGNRGRSMQ